MFSPQWICHSFTHTIPLPHLSQTGSFCRFPVGGACLTVGAFTVLVTMGRVPVNAAERHWSTRRQCRWLRRWQEASALCSCWAANFSYSRKTIWSMRGRLPQLLLAVILLPHTASPRSHLYWRAFTAIFITNTHILLWGKNDGEDKNLRWSGSGYTRQSWMETKVVDKPVRCVLVLLCYNLPEIQTVIGSVTVSRTVT